MNLLKKIWFEIFLSWEFIRYDISSTIFPSTMFAIAAWVNTQPLNPETFIVSIGRNILYFYIYVLAFTITNQIRGLEEDKINKPDRALPRKLVTLKGARKRWYVVMILYLLIGILFGVVEWTLLWMVVLTLHNNLNFGKNWVMKNLAMSLGTIALLAAAWQMIDPITDLVWRWIIVISATVFIVVAVQDLRDIEGDLKINRRTFPIWAGETRARYILIALFMTLPFIVHFGLVEPSGVSEVSIISEVILAAISTTVALRIFFLRTPLADHRTYILGTYWFVLTAGSAILIL